MGKPKYHGYTIQEINDKFYVRYSGEEEMRDLKNINSKLTRYWQEVSHYYQDSKSLLDHAVSRLRRMEEDLKLQEEEVKADLIMESRGLPKGERWSDKARETISLSRVMTSDVKAELNKLKSEVSQYKEEVAIWKEIRNNLKFISDRINNTTMAMGIEAKINRNFSVDPSDSGNPVKVEKKYIDKVREYLDEDGNLIDKDSEEEDELF